MLGPNFFRELGTLSYGRVKNLDHKHHKMWTAECPLCKSSQSLIANLTQNVSISEELNILIWNNKKSDKPFEQLSTAPRQSTNLQCKLSGVTCVSQRRMMWLLVQTTSAEGLHIFSPDCPKSGHSETATTSGLVLGAACCATPWAGSEALSKGTILQECLNSNRSNQQLRQGCLLHLARSVYRQNQYASVFLTVMLINCGRKSALGSKTTYNCHRQVLQNSQFVCDSNEKLLLLCLHLLPSVSEPVISHIPSPDSRNNTV